MSERSFATRSSFSETQTELLADEAAEAGENGEVDSSSSIKNAVFGVLYTVSKEKLDQNPKFAALKIAVDFLQIFAMILSPSFGWDIDFKRWPWKVFNIINFTNPILAKGYSVYIASMYSATALLVLAILVCFWVGWCFKNQSFPYIWPVKVLRVVVSVFFVTFYMACVNIFLVAFDCRPLAKNSTRLHMDNFENINCVALPHILHAAVAILASLAFTIVALVCTMAEFELDPLHKGWLSSPHSNAETVGFLMKSSMSIAAQLINEYTNVLEVFLLVANVMIVWAYLRWMPHYHGYINHVRTGLYTALCYAALMLSVLGYRLDSNKQHDTPEQRHTRQQLTFVMIGGMLPSFLIGLATSWLRLKLRVTSCVRAFSAMKPEQRWKDVYKFTDPCEVEIGTRCCRKYLKDDDEKVDPEGVRIAELILKAGIAQIPGNAYLTITYSNFLMSALDNYQAGHAMLQQAKKMSPGVALQFAIFVREQEHRQKSMGSNTGESAVDLVSYVEFQRNYKLLMRAHKTALLATRSFWKQILRHEISFTTLIQIFQKIDAAAATAEHTYRTVLDRYPTSVKLLRSYAHFLQEVKSDPWGAQKYLGEADKAEGEQATTGPDANELQEEWVQGQTVNVSRIDEKTNAIIIINSSGIIQMASKMALQLFGYKKQDMEGKNVNIIIPSPVSQKHQTYVGRFIASGKAHILNTVRDVVAVHKERHVFPVQMVVTHVSGAGKDSVFMGVFREVRQDPLEAKLWLDASGNVMCVDRNFTTWFARTGEECSGTKLGTLVQESEAVNAFVDLSMSKASDEERDGMSLDVSVTHKFLAPQPCTMVLQTAGTDALRLYSVSLRAKDEVGMMKSSYAFVMDGQGNLPWAGSSLSSMLGYEPSALTKLQLANLLLRPFGLLHQRWLKNGSCKLGSSALLCTIHGAAIPARLRIKIRPATSSQDEAVRVVHVERVTAEEALDEGRLVLALDSSGTVIQVVSGKASLFATTDAQLLNQPAAAFIDIFSDLERKGQMAATSLISIMLAAEGATPGLSYRVGVSSPTAGPGSLNVSRAAVMQLRADCLGDMDCVIMQLWRADALEGVAELNASGGVIRVGEAGMHDPCLLFGIPAGAMDAQPLTRFLNMRGGASMEALLEDPSAKSVLKRGVGPGAQIGPELKVEGTHADGGVVNITMQAVAKDPPTQIAQGPPRVLLRMVLSAPRKGNLKAVLDRLASVELPEGLSKHLGTGLSRSLSKRVNSIKRLSTTGPLSTAATAAAAEHPVPAVIPHDQPMLTPRGNQLLRTQLSGLTRQLSEHALGGLIDMGDEAGPLKSGTVTPPRHPLSRQASGTYARALSGLGSLSGAAFARQPSTGALPTASTKPAQQPQPAAPDTVLSLLCDPADDSRPHSPLDALISMLPPQPVQETGAAHRESITMLLQPPALQSDAAPNLDRESVAMLPQPPPVLETGLPMPSMPSMAPQMPSLNLSMPGPSVGKSRRTGYKTAEADDPIDSQPRPELTKLTPRSSASVDSDDVEAGGEGRASLNVLENMLESRPVTAMHAVLGVPELKLATASLNALEGMLDSRPATSRDPIQAEASGMGRGPASLNVLEDMLDSSPATARDPTQHSLEAALGRVGMDHLTDMPGSANSTLPRRTSKEDPQGTPRTRRKHDQRLAQLLRKLSSNLADNERPSLVPGFNAAPPLNGPAGDHILGGSRRASLEARPEPAGRKAHAGVRQALATLGETSLEDQPGAVEARVVVRSKPEPRPRASWEEDDPELHFTANLKARDGWGGRPQEKLLSSEAQEKLLSEDDRQDSYDDEVIQRQDSGELHEERRQRVQVSAYRRGKQHKKLVKLLNQPLAQREVVWLRWQSLALMAILLIIHIACFSTMIGLIQRQAIYIEELHAAVYAQDALHQMAIYSRTLQQIQSGVDVPDVYGQASKELYSSLLTTAIEAFRVRHHGILFGFEKLRRLDGPHDRVLRDVLMGPAGKNFSVMNDTTTPPWYESRQLKVFEAGQEYLAAGREVLLHHPGWSNGSWGDWGHPDWWFVVQNGARALFPAYATVADACTLRAKNAILKLESVAVALLIIEGVVVSLLAICWVWTLLKRVECQRYALVSIFLAVPAGFVRALASKELEVGDDDYDGTGSDFGDDEAVGKEGDKTQEAGDAQPPQQDDKPQDRPRLPKALRSVMEEDNIRRRSSGGSVVSVTTRTAMAWRAIAMPPMTERPSLRAAWRVVVGLLSGKHAKVQPVARRHLVQNAKETRTMSLSFMVWAVLVVCLYAASVERLNTQTDSVENLRVTYRVSTWTMRAIFFAQELAASTPDLQATARAENLASSNSLNANYNLMVSGGAVTSTLSSHVLHTQGTAFQAKRNLDLLYQSSANCLGDATIEPCLTANDTFSSLVDGGLDIMMRQLVKEAKLLSADSAANISLASPRFHYIWRVGMNNVHASLLLYSSIVTDYVLNVFDSVKTMHIVLFVCSWILAAAFIFLLLRPFVKQTGVETKRVAELLSQLPSEINVERLVENALVKGAKELAARRARRPSILGAYTAIMAKMARDGSPRSSLDMDDHGLPPRGLDAPSQPSRFGSVDRPSRFSLEGPRPPHRISLEAATKLAFATPSSATLATGIDKKMD